jgi:excisionase family DNA binding protein
MSVAEQVLYRVPEAAAKLAIGKSKMWELIGRGEIESVKIDNARRITSEALAEYVERLRAGSPDAAA